MQSPVDIPWRLYVFYCQVAGQLGIGTLRPQAGNIDEISRTFQRREIVAWISLDVLWASRLGRVGGGDQ